MRFRVERLALLVALLLAGCASGPAYVSYNGSSGYSEVEIRPDVFDISYHGRERMSDGQAMQYAKLRGAELARQRGRAHFRILGRSIEGRTTYRTFTRDVRLQSDDRLATMRVPVTDIDIGQRPVALLTVYILDEPADDTFEAEAVLRQAVNEGRVEPDRFALAPITRPN